jgi:RNA polymerase sigma-70 factor (ECF subfamily)
VAAVKLALVTGDVISDEELLERMAGGDRDALGLLFDRHHRALFGFLARAYPAEDADLDDLVQSAFLEAFRAAPRFRGAAAVRTWLFAIGSNLAKMHRRATSRRTRALQRFADLPVRAAGALDAALADQRTLARIEHALDELPHDLRVAYAMCVIEGVAAEDAARALGVARGTIWRRVHQARQALRAAIDAEGAR